MTSFVQGRKMTAALLALIVGSSFFCRMALNSLQESLQTGMGLNDNQVALVQGTAMAIPAVLGGVPVGLLVDRFDRARLLTMFCLVNLIGTISTALSTDLVMLFASRAMVGFSTAAVAITAPSLLADLFPRSQRGRGSMIYGVSQVGGMAAAFAAGGALVAILHAPDMWRSGALVMSCPLLGVLLLSLLLREQERMEIAEQRPTLAGSAVELWNFRSVFAPLFCGVVAIGVADGATLVWVVPTLSRSFGMGAGYASGVMGMALVIGGLLGPILGGFAADRCLNSGGAARAMTLLASLAALSGALGLFALAPGGLSASICLTAFLLVGSMINSVSLTLITVLLPNELRGFCVAVLSVVLILFSFGLAPSLVSITAAGIGGPADVGIALAMVCGTASVVSGAAFLFGREHLKRRPRRHGRMPERTMDRADRASVLHP
ncbi:MFS transporter [Rhizorhabdus wittichii DC-6]|nr:MFS transporter [Rhizorhabdus wittichii DC-6]